MYLEHFGLQRPPFKITPDTSMFYSGNKRGAALEALKYAIGCGEGIIKVVGEVGSGKTMLCRMLEVELADNIEIVYIANPSLSPDKILHAIAFELKLKIQSASSKLEVMQALQTYLLEKHANNKQVVVFVEEAQSMPIETLEEIRLLSNLETNDDKLLQMVLFGQPELDEKLRNHSIRQLKERITQNFYLDPFTAADVYSYLNFRMRAVGYRGVDLFSTKMANNIERKSNGLTRRINILADKALLAAFSDGGHDITSHHIKLAAKDSDFGQDINWQPVIKFLIAITTILLAVWIGTLLPESIPEPTTEPTTEPTPLQITQNQLANNNHTPAILPNTTREKPTDQTKNSNRQLTNLPIIIKTNDNINDILQNTKHWIKHATDENFTIQLTLIDGNFKNDARRFIQKMHAALDLNKIYIYPVSIRGRLFYSVIFNEYTNRDQANEQLKSLPLPLQKSGPYLRTIKGIKADITKTRQHQFIKKDNLK